MLWTLFPTVPLVSCILLQSVLTNHVVHSNLTVADQLTLGVVRVWGMGTGNVSEVVLTDSTGTQHQLGLEQDTSTQVRGSAFIPV